MLPLLALLTPGFAADAPTLSVETFNTGLAHGFVNHAEARRPHIVAALATTDADLVCLQEVWDRKDRKQLEQALGETYPHRFVPEIVVQRAPSAPACKRSDLFGEGRFIACMDEQCGDTEGDARTDCIIKQCDAELDALRTSKPGCAQALFAQVGRSTLGAVMALLSPFRAARTYAYRGSTGLMLLSRRPLVDQGIVDFTDISTLNRRAALWADVRLADDTTARVYCTHLTAELTGLVPYPGPFPGWPEENRAQIDRLITHADAVQHPVVLTGDFNCGLADQDAGLIAEAPESCAALNEAGYADITAALDAPPCTWCADNLLNVEEGDTTNSLLDHLFVRGLRPTEQARRYDDPVSIDVKKEGPTRVTLSDHFGYGATLTPGAFPEPEPEPEPEPDPEPAPESETADPVSPSEQTGDGE